MTQWVPQGPQEQSQSQQEPLQTHCTELGPGEKGQSEEMHCFAPSCARHCLCMYIHMYIFIHMNIQYIHMCILACV